VITKNAPEKTSWTEASLQEQVSKRQSFVKDGWATITTSVQGPLSLADSTKDGVDVNQRSGIEDTHPIETMPTANEEILAWFQGTVLSVGASSFEVELCDLEGTESVAVIEKRAAGHAQQGDIREGARFVYYVSRIDQIDGANTLSRIEFLPSYIHQSADEPLITQRLLELYDK
jgi:hypothetical protein